ncbi:hypothetical protein A2U01_0101927, partial [Trifolium medium]|nr:hypothetical protein [Trifolium medium]
MLRRCRFAPTVPLPMMHGYSILDRVSVPGTYRVPVRVWYSP